MKKIIISLISLLLIFLNANFSAGDVFGPIPPTCDKSETYMADSCSEIEDIVICDKACEPGPPAKHCRVEGSGSDMSCVGYVDCSDEECDIIFPEPELELMPEFSTYGIIAAIIVIAAVLFWFIRKKKK